MSDNNTDTGDKKIEELKKLNSLNPHPEKVTAQLFRESEFFDSRDLVQVKYEMLRSVDKGEQTVIAACSEFGFARRSFYQIKQSYEDGGISALSHKKRGPKGRYKLSDAVVSFINEAHRRDRSSTAKDIQGLVESEFDITVHIRSIQRVIAGVKKK